MSPLLSASQLADVVESNRSNLADLKWPDVSKVVQEEIDFDSQVIFCLIVVCTIFKMDWIILVDLWRLCYCYCIVFIMVILLLLSRFMEIMYYDFVLISDRQKWQHR
jgi:hypothetical protein